MATITGILLFVAILLSGVCVLLSKRLEDSKKEAKAADEKYRKLFEQKKSSEVKLGGIAEQMAPFLDSFPCNKSDAHFLGQPIDYVAFAEDGVHFIEIKSGDAQLSPKQRVIRDQLLAGKVHWHIVRIKK